MVCCTLYQVLCIVKPLAAARYSQIRYQAVVVWTGSDKNMPQVGRLACHFPPHCCHVVGIWRDVQFAPAASRDGSELEIVLRSRQTSAEAGQSPQHAWQVLNMVFLLVLVFCICILQARDCPCPYPGQPAAQVCHGLCDRVRVRRKLFDRAGHAHGQPEQARGQVGQVLRALPLGGCR